MHMQRFFFGFASIFVGITLIFSAFILAITTAPQHARAGGGGGFLTAVLVVAAIVIAPYIAPELFGTIGTVAESAAMIEAGTVGIEGLALEASVLGGEVVAGTVAGVGIPVPAGMPVSADFAAALTDVGTNVFNPLITHSVADPLVAGAVEYGSGYVIAGGAELAEGLIPQYYLSVAAPVASAAGGAGVATALTAVAIGATGAVISSDGSTGTTGSTLNVQESSNNINVTGESCYSAPNACGQAYSGVLAYADDGTLTCYQSNAPTVVLPTTPPPNDTCPAASGSANSCTWAQMTGREFSCTTAGGYPQDVDVSAYVDGSGLPWMRLVGHCYYFAGYVAFDTGYKQGTSITGSGTCPVGFQWTVAGNAQLTLNGANIMSAHSTYGGGYPGSCSVPAPSTCSPAPAAPSTASASTPTWTNYCTGANDPFGHSWQIWRYDNSNPPNYEFVKTDLAVCGPLAKLDGSCSATHWNCITGTSANNTGGTAGPWTWSCKGSNGGIDVACLQSGGGTGTGTSGTGTTGTGSCVVKGGIALKQCSGSAPGSSLVSYNNCGAVVDSQSCEYGCSGGACNAPSPIGFTPFTANNPKGTSSTFTATGNLQVNPVLVKRDDSTWLYWNVENASSCSVTSSAAGENADAWPNASWPNAFFSGNSGQKSKPIQGHTVFTLHCTPLPPLEGDPPLNSLTETRSVDIAPIFQEI